MPLSFLVHTSRLTIASVIRPCARGQSRNNGNNNRNINTSACTHGFGIKTTPGLVSSKAHLKRTTSASALDMKILARLFSSQAVVGVLGLSGVLGCRTGNANGTKNVKAIQSRNHSGCATKYAPEIEELFHGNVDYIQSMNKMNPGLLANLAKNGQQPPFMMVDCSDSRVSEQDIFSAKPGTMFTAGNIANRFDEDDANSNAILSFAVETLKVKHVIVMGHYGCGGVAASMLPFDASAVVNASRADLAVQGWIKPIRELYMGSERPEIVAHREKHKNKPLTDLPELHDPAFRALVEENVKANVFKISKSRVMVDHYAKLAKSNLTVTSTTASSSSNPYGNKPITDVYIHGWVYDVENGRVSDLGVSVGPPGKEVFGSPFPGVGQ